MRRKREGDGGDWLWGTLRDRTVNCACVSRHHTGSHCSVLNPRQRSLSGDRTVHLIYVPAQVIAVTGPFRGEVSLRPWEVTLVPWYRSFQARQAQLSNPIRHCWALISGVCSPSAANTTPKISPVEGMLGRGTLFLEHPTPLNTYPKRP